MSTRRFALEVSYATKRPKVKTSCVHHRCIFRRHASKAAADKKHKSLVRVGRGIFEAPHLDETTQEIMKSFCSKRTNIFRVKPAGTDNAARWAIIGPGKSKLAFLQMLRGDFAIHPQNDGQVAPRYQGRAYPWFVDQKMDPKKGIALVEFSGAGLGDNVRGEYMSSR